MSRDNIQDPKLIPDSKFHIKIFSDRIYRIGLFA